MRELAPEDLSAFVGRWTDCGKWLLENDVWVAAAWGRDCQRIQHDLEQAISLVTKSCGRDGQTWGGNELKSLLLCAEYSQ